MSRLSLSHDLITPNIRDRRLQEAAGSSAVTLQADAVAFLVCIATCKSTCRNRILVGPKALPHCATLLQEWESNDGAVLPIQCIMDVIGNAFNSNNPAGLPVAQQLLPLIVDSRKGPAIDFDAFLLAMLEEHAQGTV